ncbi:NADH-quinone oxidoreductase subunit A [Paraconexibacter antarcticus]|uniref:NADH-quinone oxidoreductase subunit A n=1 Tax=Paraconexibacter antarcticus TaxID=2949664 RepID=A0ABY5DT32_9ACTN|nr:NADH-quinone oxidoreductase subunit A [Paraconexibacter antarcticus]UTI64079.1 NADH-quinone oxidoreductase subunit A [Paraconexibacter antarcticus]
MLRGYLPAIVFLALGVGIGSIFASLNSLVGVKKKKIQSKNDPYECGLPSEIQQRFRFGISFYLIAMLFILFDIEVLFLYPVAMNLRAFGTFALVEIIVFVVLLFVAFIYVWRRGALEWR